MDGNMSPNFYPYTAFGMGSPFYQQNSTNQYIFQLNSQILNLESDKSQMAQQIEDLQRQIGRL